MPLGPGDREPLGLWTPTLYPILPGRVTPLSLPGSRPPRSPVPTRRGVGSSVQEVPPRVPRVLLFLIQGRHYSFEGVSGRDTEGSRTPDSVLDDWDRSTGEEDPERVTGRGVRTVE